MTEKGKGKHIYLTAQTVFRLEAFLAQNFGTHRALSMIVQKAIEDYLNKLGEPKRFKDSNGYVQVYNPDRAYPMSYVSEHILVAEETVGHRLNSDEVVHHINGIRDDNRPENLQVMSQHEHCVLSGKEAAKKRYNKIK